MPDLHSFGRCPCAECIGGRSQLDNFAQGWNAGNYGDFWAVLHTNVVNHGPIRSCSCGAAGGRDRETACSIGSIGLGGASGLICC